MTRSTPRLGLWAARVTFGLLAPALLAPALLAETIADAMAAAYENSGLLEQNRALLRVADEDVALAVASLRPVINWQLAAVNQNPHSIFSDSLSLTASISAEMTLWDGGRDALAVEVQKELVLGTRAGLLGVEQQVLLRAVQAYMEVSRTGEFVSLRENNVRLITQELRAAQDRFDVGEVTRTDVALAEARLAAARSFLASEQGQLARALQEYETAVGHSARGIGAAPPAPIRYSLAEATQVALRTHPSLIEAQRSVSASELNIARAERAMSPTLSLGATLQLDDEGTRSDRLSLTLGGPIYQGGRLTAQVRQFIARRDAARAQLLITAQTIAQNVANAWSFIEVARASRDASERQVRAASSAFDTIREEANLGQRTTLDVLNAEQELLDARANLISAEADETTASYTLLSAMGLLTAQQLNLRVQIYDPAAYYNLVRDAPAIMSEQGAALDRVLQAIGD